MQYILMVQFKLGKAATGGVGTWSPDEAKLSFDRFNKELAEAGELVSVVSLGGLDDVTIVQAQKDGTAFVSEGPFPDSKEYLAGYWIVEVDRPERAHEIAARISALPGPGGAPTNLPVEVRRVVKAASGDV